MMSRHPLGVFSERVFGEVALFRETQELYDRVRGGFLILFQEGTVLGS